jgi:Zn-dependent M28 family amino/carboxypeptidase
MRATNKHLRIVFLITAVFASALAQQPPPTSAPNVERLRGHIEHLASDKLEGRRTGTQGANLAAEYIAREFARYGLRRSVGRDLPGMSRLEADSPRRYMQEFPYVGGVELGKKNLLTIRSKEKQLPINLRLGEDWMPLGFSSNGAWDYAPATFVGYGITATELNHDDYAEPQVKGKIAVALSGTPDGENAHGQFARYDDVRWKAIAARNAGAIALIVIARAENFKEDRLSRLRYDNSGGEAGLPVAAISRQAAAQLFQTDAAGLIKLAPRPGEDGNQIPHVNFYIDVVRREVNAANVIGILDGSDPTLKNETIVIGAHYDHLGLGGEGSLAPKEGEIHHGADDNASGTAGLLELARLFAVQSPRPKRTIVFIAFSGEEEGLLGSNYYVNHPIVPLANTIAMINMDMIGRLKDNKLIVGGVGTAQNWRELIAFANTSERMNVTATGEPAASAPETTSNSGPARRPLPIVISANGRTIVTLEPSHPFALTLNEDGFGPSDHSSFYAKQIPVLFFWTGTHEDYHKPSDTADKINYADEARILSLITRLVRSIDTDPQRPTYLVTKSPAAGRSTGFSVSLGTIPNYADSNDGLLLDGVRADSPAAKAGIGAGDRIVKLAGRDIRNVYDYTAALGEMRAGQEYEVELMRGGARLKLMIIPAARK